MFWTNYYFVSNSTFKLSGSSIFYDFVGELYPLILKMSLEWISQTKLICSKHSLRKNLVEIILLALQCVFFFWPSFFFLLHSSTITFFPVTWNERKNVPLDCWHLRGFCSLYVVIFKDVKIYWSLRKYIGRYYIVKNNRKKVMCI